MRKSYNRVKQRHHKSKRHHRTGGTPNQEEDEGVVYGPHTRNQYWLRQMDDYIKQKPRGRPRNQNEKYDKITGYPIKTQADMDSLQMQYHGIKTVPEYEAFIAMQEMKSMFFHKLKHFRKMQQL